MASSWGSSWGTSWGESWCRGDVISTPSRSRGDAYVRQRPQSRPRRYLDRVEQEDRLKLLRALDEAVEEVTGEEAPAKPLKKKQEKQIARLVQAEMLAAPALIAVDGSAWAQIAASMADVESLVRAHLEFIRLRAAAAEQERLEYEYLMMEDDAAVMALALLM